MNVRIVIGGEEHELRFKTLWQAYYHLVDLEAEVLASTIIANGCVAWWAERFMTHWEVKHGCIR